MKEFDWAHCAEERGTEMAEYIKKSVDANVTEDVFVVGYQKVPRPRGLPKRGKRSPSTARKCYRNLKKSFGFFYGS